MDADTPPPTVPPRSTLRGPSVPQRRSSMTLLSMIIPLPEDNGTPSLSSGNSSGVDLPQPTPPILPPKEQDTTIVFGRKKSVQRVSAGKDPLRIRDGLVPKRSTSGVYTRKSSHFHCTFSRHADLPAAPTFPGPQGQNPPQPTNSALHLPGPTPNTYSYLRSGPSRSSSVSSAGSESPVTPAFTFTASRFPGMTGRTMSGLKRISNQLGVNTSHQSSIPNSSISTASITSPVINTTTSNSPFDPYFSPHISGNNTRNRLSTSTHSRYSSYAGPVTPVSATHPTFPPSPSVGLGAGLDEEPSPGYSPEKRARSDNIASYTDSSGMGDVAPNSPQAKVKRKPVPTMVEDDMSHKVEGLQIETHAF